MWTKHNAEHRLPHPRMRDLPHAEPSQAFGSDNCSPPDAQVLVDDTSPSRGDAIEARMYEATAAEAGALTVVHAGAGASGCRNAGG